MVFRTLGAFLEWGGGITTGWSLVFWFRGRGGVGLVGILTGLFRCDVHKTLITLLVGEVILRHTVVLDVVRGRREGAEEKVSLCL